MKTRVSGEHGETILKSRIESVFEGTDNAHLNGKTALKLAIKLNQIKTVLSSN